MLKPALFKPGENDFQFYYYFKNEVTGEEIQIIRSKFEKEYFGLFKSKNDLFVIPVYTDEDAQIMLERVCEWYNSGKPRPDLVKLPDVEKKRISKTLTKIEGMFGYNHKGALRIQAYLDDPSVDRWHDISSIVIHPSLLTVWQAMLEYDPTFPSEGRITDITGKVIREWTRIPTKFELLRAIQKALQLREGYQEKVSRR